MKTNILLLGGAFFCMQAHALINVSFTGTITNGSSRPDQASIFFTGATVSGELIIDTDTPQSLLLEIPGESFQGSSQISVFRAPFLWIS